MTEDEKSVDGVIYFSKLHQFSVLRMPQRVTEGHQTKNRTKDSDSRRHAAWNLEHGLVLLHHHSL